MLRRSGLHSGFSQGRTWNDAELLRRSRSTAATALWSLAARSRHGWHYGIAHEHGRITHYHCPPGSLRIIAPGPTSVPLGDDSLAGERLFACFDAGPWHEALLGIFQDESQHAIFDDTSGSLYQQLRTLCLWEDSETAAGVMRAHAALLTLLCELLEHRRAPAQPAHGRAHSVEARRLWRCLHQAVTARLDNPPKLAAIAEACACSPATLTRQCRTFFAESPMAITRRIRLERATELLRLGNTVTDTAEACGFASPQHFSSAFKHVYALTPSAWLARHGLNDSA